MLLAVGGVSLLFTVLISLKNSVSECLCSYKLIIYMILVHVYLVVVMTYTFNNYWMRLTMISRFIQTEAKVTCRSEAEADNFDRALDKS